MNYAFIVLLKKPLPGLRVKDFLLEVSVLHFYLDPCIALNCVLPQCKFVFENMYIQLLVSY